MSENAGERGSYHHGDLRRALVAASLELIQGEGLQALSLRKAARKAGVSSGAPYHHFQNRGELLKAIAFEGFELLAQEMDRRREGLTDPTERLTSCGIAYVAFAQSHPAYFKVMFRPELTEELASVDDRPGHAVFLRLVAAIVEAQASGHAPAGDPERLILTAWSTAHGLSSLLVDGPLCRNFDLLQVKPEEIGALVMRTLGELFKAAAASPPASPIGHE